jgi:pyridoxal phosphate enzyme (YggS family)
MIFNKEAYFHIKEQVKTLNKNLLIVTKNIPLEIIEETINLGHNLFGENKVQEAKSKWTTVKEKHPNLKLHMIGRLQTNKTKEALKIFDVIQTIDNFKIANEIFKYIDKTSNKEFYIQVNTANEKQKAGISINEAGELIEHSKNELGLNVTGLMCIPPINDNPQKHFSLLKEIAVKNNLPNLSMGMSKDYKIALEMGATMIRIGQALFK